MVNNKDFTGVQINEARKIIIERVKKCKIKNDAIFGNPFISYQELLDLVNKKFGTNYIIENEYDGSRAGYLPGGVSEKECAHGLPMLGALVVNKETGKPGNGFFKLAIQLGKMKKRQDKDVFFFKECFEIVKLYGKK